MSLRSLRPVSAALQGLRVDVLHWLAGTGVTLGELVDPATRVPASRVVEAWERAERLAGVDDLGLRAAAFVDLRLLPGLDHVDELLLLKAIGAADTVGDALRVMPRVNPAVSPLLTYALAREGHLRALHLATVAPTRSPALHTFMVVMVLSVLRQATGTRIVPAAVRLAVDALPSGPELADVLGVAPTLGPTTTVLFDPGTLAVPVLTAAPDTLRAIEALAARQVAGLGPAEATLRQLRGVIVARLVTGAPSVAEAARALGTSVRTLSRRLQECGTTFRAVVDEARAETATRLLADGTRDLGAVAVLAGFADERSLRRALDRRAPGGDGTSGP